MTARSTQLLSHLSALSELLQTRSLSAPAPAQDDLVHGSSSQPLASVRLGDRQAENQVSSVTKQP
jgi:hypothetical protein